ncbi:CMRF35-like molecule 3 [Pangasianodon hypophthalmus]|uniref:CMRF35-like molecule 3 n=1 Tax=Pangasianodon hypophthalmus TaxID=310915 RepID=UPI00230807D8|nr:CMRF35-like molecule 3 [Pangasianodon hypophthalmus]
MKIFLIFTFCLIIADTDAATTVTGYRGRSVQIKCPYESGYEENNKYLCRGECSIWPGSKDIPVESRSAAKDTRFSLYDNTTAKVFTVNITDLRPEDEGTYWCVIQRTGPNIYREILLLVKTDDPTSTSVSHPTHTTHSASTHAAVHAASTHSTTANPQKEANHSTNAPSPPEFHTLTVIIAVSVVLVLLLIVLSFAFAVQRKKRTRALSPAQSPQSSSDLHVVPCPIYDYEEIKDSKCLANTLYSTAMIPSDPYDLYSNIGLPTDPNDSSQIVYASVQRPSDSPDQDIYSTAQLPTILSDSSASAAQPLVVKSEICESPTYAAVSIDSGSNGAAVTVIFENENSSCDYAIVNVT